MKISRRDLGLGVAAAAVLGGAAVGYRRLFGPWYAPTPYDDLLHQIVDREPAAKLGHSVVHSMPHFDVARLADELRQPGYALGKRAKTDAAAGRVVEAGGWLVPETVALYSALASAFS
jgi:hypothetical protein